MWLKMAHLKSLTGLVNLIDTSLFKQQTSGRRHRLYIMVAQNVANALYAVRNIHNCKYLRRDLKTIMLRTWNWNLAHACDMIWIKT